MKMAEPSSNRENRQTKRLTQVGNGHLKVVEGGS
jgi:hypothetical protein